MSSAPAIREFGKVKDWQVPVFESAPQTRFGWLTEQIQDGEAWFRAQKTTEKTELAMRLLDASGGALATNTLKADIRKFVETISDVREIATFGTGAEQFKKIADMYNRTLKHIYHKSFFARQSRKVLQWAVAGCRGYMWPRYIRKGYGWGDGVFEFKDLAACDVLPTQLPSDFDVQEAYAETIMDVIPIAEAHARFPMWQDELLPVSKVRLTSNDHVRRMEFWDRWRFQGKGDWERLYCEIRYTFIRDLRINRTGNMLPMGDKGTSWYYEVPSVGSLIAGINPDNMLPESHAAKVEECRLYPQLRMMISNPGMSQPMYDGPAFDQHGMMPAIPYDVDDWPWLAIGYSLINDVAGTEVAQRKFTDLMHRVIKVNMNPPLGYDYNSGIAREDIKNLKVLDESGTKIGTDGDPRKALVSLLPEGVRVTDQDFKFLDLLDKLRQKQLGLNDVSSLEKLKFNLSAENVDKILETIGPIAKGINANLQVAHAKIAYMLKFMIPQYLTTKKLMSFIGPDGIDIQVFDFDPNSLVPSHLPEEANLIQAGKDSNFTKEQRARRFAENIEVIAVPDQLLNITQMQEQMKWLNFLQRQMPVSYSTAMKKLGIENWGDSPGATEFEKWQYEQREIAKVKIDVMKSVAADMPPGAADGGGQGKGGGRKPSGQNPPKLEQRGNKNGNPRTVMSQSK